MGISETVNLLSKYSAWSGTAADLGRILGVISNQIEDLIPAHIESETESTRGRLATYQQWVERDQERFDRAVTRNDPSMAAAYEDELRRDQKLVQQTETELNAKRAKAEDAAKIAVVVQTGEARRSVLATPAEAIEYLDGRPFDTLELSAPGTSIRGYNITLSGDRDSGVVLRVASRDDRWATAAASYIRDEVKRNVPWWGWLRNSIVLYVFYFVGIGIVAYNLANVIATLTTPTGKFPSEWQSLAWGIWSFVVIVTSALAMIWTKRYVRAFDLVREGQRARGAWLARVIGSSVGAVVLSVIATRLAEWLATAGI